MTNLFLIGLCRNAWNLEAANVITAIQITVIHQITVTDQTMVVVMDRAMVATDRVTVVATEVMQDTDIINTNIFVFAVTSLISSSFLIIIQLYLFPVVFTTWIVIFKKKKEIP